MILRYFLLAFFQKADDRLALSNAKSGMFEQRKISLKEAPLIFNLWDNVYHQNGVRNLETNGRWDPSKLATEHKNAKKKKEKIEVSSEEEESEG